LGCGILDIIIILLKNGLKTYLNGKKIKKEIDRLKLIISLANQRIQDEEALINRWTIKLEALEELLIEPVKPKV
jgi:hypothetical protein